MISLIIKIYILAHAVLANDTYKNSTIYDVTPQNIRQLNHIELLKYKEGCNCYEFLKKIPSAVGVSEQVIVSVESQKKFEDLMTENGIQFEVMVPDVQEIIDEYAEEISLEQSAGRMRWDVYYRLEYINHWMSCMNKVNKKELVKIVKSELTQEKRRVEGIKVVFSDSKDFIFVEAAMNPRDWMATAVTNYLLDQVLNNRKTELSSVAKSYNWYIFPVANPDGYAWTFDEDRLWQKNRVNNGEYYGVNLNYNFDHLWGNLTIREPSSPKYAGRSALSEVEAGFFAEVMKQNKDKIKLYLSMGSGEQLILVPFGNTTEHLANYDEAIDIATKAAEVVKANHGTEYTVGNVAERIHVLNGLSTDWAKAVLEIPLVYTIRLKEGYSGPIVCPSMINSTAVETMDAVLTIIKEAAERKILKS